VFSPLSLRKQFIINLSMKKILLFLFITILIPSITLASNFQRFWLTKDLDNYKGIIEDASGNQYLIEYGIGCLSFWRYEQSLSKDLYVDIGGSYLDGIGDTLYLNDDDQSCRIWSAEPLSSNSNNTIANGNFCENSVSYSKKVGGNITGYENTYYGSKDGETSFYYDANCKYPVTSKDIQYMSEFIMKTCGKSVDIQEILNWGKIISAKNSNSQFEQHYIDLCKNDNSKKTKGKDSIAD
jgi:hypothetical protein